MKPRFLSLGDSAVTVEFGNQINKKLLATVTAFDALLRHECESGNLPGLIETVPTYRSLTIIFEPALLTAAKLKDRIMPLIEHLQEQPVCPGRTWRLPVCYEAEYGIDLKQLAPAKGMSVSKIIELHASRTYTVYMIGFLPGFPFMGDLDKALQVPRLKEPRTRVPAGSVAIAGQQTAIYPWESPGGWHIIGRCPIPLFDPQDHHPALLASGDQVIFEPITSKQYLEIALKFADNSLRPDKLLNGEHL